MQLGAALLALALLTWGGLPPMLRGARLRFCLILAIMVLLLPVLHLVPLPPAIWQALPGRETAATSLALIGQDEAWRPLSLTPGRTLATALSMLPPLFLLFLVASMPLEKRVRLLWALVVLALFALALGAAQLAGGNQGPYLYEHAHRGWLTGFFANRNAAGDFFLFALMLPAVLQAMAEFDLAGRRGGRTAPARRASVAALSVVFALAVILTGSRTAIAMLPIVFLAQLAILAMVRNSRAAHRSAYQRSLPWLAIGSALVLAGLIFGPRITVLSLVAERFDFAGDFRTEVWTDSWVVLKGYWPVGGGFGSFAPSFMMVERLDILAPPIVNRAHNDYLELAIEAGLPGLCVLALAAGACALMALRAWKCREQRPLVLLALGTFAVVSLHSFVDYPLRTMAMMGLVALVVGLMAPLPGKDGAHDGAHG